MNDVWDFVMAQDAKRQAIRDIKSKEQKIKELSTECGSCEFWMTNKCKREKAQKVTCGMPVCIDFEPPKWVVDSIGKLQKDVADLRLSLAK